MALITEQQLKAKSKELCNDKVYVVNKGDIITPAAISFLNEKDIRIKYSEDFDEGIKDTQGEPKTTTYTTIFGAKLDEKPEHMTHLRGDLLVFKDHPRIALRGKIDSLESKILETQILCTKRNKNKLVEDLQEVLTFIRLLMRYEVSGEPVKEFVLQGLNPDQLRDYSHHPSKYFGIKHFLPDHKMGELVVALNSLRTLTRETELQAFKAFKGQYGEMEREDIIRAFNRLSSLFWIMMFKILSGKYD